MKHKLTERHRKIFQAEIVYWQRKLLIEWEIGSKLKSLGTAAADCEVNFEAMLLTMHLNQYWKEKPTHKELCLCAFHECIEGLFAAYDHILADILALSPHLVTEPWLDQAEEKRHKIIQTLCNGIWEADYEKRQTEKKKKVQT